MTRVHSHDRKWKARAAERHCPVNVAACSRSCARAALPLGAKHHYEELLRIERNDHIALGMLITGYIELRRFDDARKLIAEREEDRGTHLRYGEMVRRYLLGEQGPTLWEAMKRALWANQHVPKLLDNPKTEVVRSPFGVSRGGADEAADYVEVSHRLWDAYPKVKRVLIAGSDDLLPEVEFEKQQQIRKWRGEL